jgi:hypothetical protein
MDDALGLEWARIAPDKVVVATADRAFLHTPEGFGGSDRFGGPMRGPGSAATTKRLLDGAVGAGQRAAVRAEALPPLTPARWALRLAGYYRTTHATPALMEEAAERFAAAGRRSLAGWAAHKARDERGHDELALRDLRALGYDAERVVEALSPPTAAALVDYFVEAVRAEDPVGCVGYAYALERLALGQTEAYVKRVEAMLPVGIHATRCLRVHSAAGSDAGHVAETIAMVAGLSALERAQIALACYETTALCYAPKRGEIIAEDTLARELSTLKTKKAG